MHDYDLLRRQSHPGIFLHNAGVVPHANFAQIDLGKHVAAEPHIARARNVINRHHGTQHRGICTSFTFDEANASSLIGISDAPKSTSPDVTCRMPPPEPID